MGVGDTLPDWPTSHIPRSSKLSTLHCGQGEETKVKIAFQIHTFRSNSNAPAGRSGSLANCARFPFVDPYESSQGPRDCFFSRSLLLEREISLPARTAATRPELQGRLRLLMLSREARRDEGGLQ